MFDRAHSRRFPIDMKTCQAGFFDVDFLHHVAERVDAFAQFVVVVRVFEPEHYVAFACAGRGLGEEHALPAGDEGHGVGVGVVVVGVVGVVVVVVVVAVVVAIAIAAASLGGVGKGDIAQFPFSGGVEEEVIENDNMFEKLLAAVRSGVEDVISFRFGGVKEAQFEDFVKGVGGEEEELLLQHFAVADNVVPSPVDTLRKQ